MRVAHTILLVKRRLSSRRSRAILYSFSVRGGLYMLKNSSGHCVENICASRARKMGKYAANMWYALTGEVDKEIPEALEMWLGRGCG